MNHCMQAKSHVIYKIIRHTSKMPYVPRRGNCVHYNYINNYLSIFRPFYEIFSSSCKVGFLDYNVSVLQRRNIYFIYLKLAVSFKMLFSYEAFGLYMYYPIFIACCGADGQQIAFIQG